MPHRRLTLPPGCLLVSLGAASQTGLENGQGPPSHMRLSKTSCVKNLGPRLPMPSPFTSAHPSAHHTTIASGLLASLGLTLTLGGPSRGHSQGDWCHNPWDWGHRDPAPDSPCCHALYRAHWGTAAKPVQENGQGPLSPRRNLKAPRAKTLGPMLPFPAPKPGPESPLTSQPSDRVCGPPGG